MTCTLYLYTYILYLFLITVSAESPSYDRLIFYTKADIVYRDNPEDNFWGNIAAVGEDANITCQGENEDQDIWKGLNRIVNNSR